MPQWDPKASTYLVIGQRLSHLRHALGLTQRQLADQLNITGPRWANYEVGTSRIPVDVALRLVEKWEVSLDWVYYGKQAGMPKALLRSVKAAAKQAARPVSRSARAKR